MKIETLEYYIKKTTIPYGDLLRRAKRGGLNVEEIKDSNGTVEVSNAQGDKIELFFEDTTIYEENKTNGLIASRYNYAKR